MKRRREGKRNQKGRWQEKGWRLKRGANKEGKQEGR